MTCRSDKEPYKFEGHNGKGVIVGKTYCTKCGLVYLNNAMTRWCIQKGCNAEDHPSYSQTLKRLTSPN